MHNNHRRVGWNDWYDATEAGNAHRWRTAPKGLLGNPSVSYVTFPNYARDALACDPGRRKPSGPRAAGKIPGDSLPHRRVPRGAGLPGNYSVEGKQSRSGVLSGCDGGGVHTSFADAISRESFFSVPPENVGGGCDQGLCPANAGRLPQRSDCRRPLLRLRHRSDHPRLRVRYARPPGRPRRGAVRRAFVHPDATNIVLRPSDPKMRQRHPSPSTEDTSIPPMVSWGATVTSSSPSSSVFEAPLTHVRLPHPSAWSPRTDRANVLRDPQRRPKW